MIRQISARENRVQAFQIGCFIDPGVLYPRIRKTHPSGLDRFIQFPFVKLDAPRSVDSYQSLFGEPVEITIWGYGISSTNEGAAVRLWSRNWKIRRLISDMGANRRAYLPLSVSKSGNPFDTRCLVFEKLEEPIVLTGYFGAKGSDGSINAGEKTMACYLYGPPTSGRSNQMRFEGIVNKKTKISARSISDLKRKASKAANQTDNSIDTMDVVATDDMGSQICLPFIRMNTMAPNNTIRRGTWL